MNERNTPYAVSITGKSGSGKSTVSRIITNKLREFGYNTFVLRGDLYYKTTTDEQKLSISRSEQNDELEDGYPNFDIPSAIDYDDLSEDLRLLQTGKIAYIPGEYSYNNKNSNSPSIPEKTPVDGSKYDFIILDYLLLDAQFRFMNLPTHVLLKPDSNERRIERDIKEGRTQAGNTKLARQIIHRDVDPGYDKYTVPILYNHKNSMEHENYYEKDATIIANFMAAEMIFNRSQKKGIELSDNEKDFINNSRKAYDLRREERRVEYNRKNFFTDNYSSGHTIRSVNQRVPF